MQQQISQSLQTLKNTIDAALKAGVIVNMEHANAILQAFDTIVKAINKPNDSAAN